MALNRAWVTSLHVADQVEKALILTKQQVASVRRSDGAGLYTSTKFCPNRSAVDHNSGRRFAHETHGTPVLEVVP